MDKKQTAVEWLVQQMGDKEYILWNDKPWWDELVKLIEQAKAMEKQQIMKAYGQGIADEAGEILDATKDAQQYYNKTYTND